MEACPKFCLYMKFRSKIHGVVQSLVLFVAGCGLALSEDEARIGELIAELSDDSFKTRESAARALWEIGDKAVEPLKEASISDDPERAMRAAEILLMVELHITPKTPKQVIDLVELYRKSGTEQKGDILNKLRQLQAYHQMLRLYALDRPEVRAVLAQHVRGVAILGAREAILNNDIEAAIGLLEACANEKDSLTALASLYRSIGRIDEELEVLNPPKNVSTDDWKLALLRAKGNLDEVIALASKTKEHRLLAAMQVLSGDPVLWLEQNGLGNDRFVADEVYIEIALKRWKGQPVVERDYAPLLKLLESRDEDEKSKAMSSLALLGRLEELRKVQAEDSPSDGFLYYLSMEEIPMALRAIGLDPEKPDYKGWVKTRFDEMMQAEEGIADDESSALAEILMMASFLEKRGLREELEDAFAENLTKFAKEYEGAYLDLLGSMLEGTYGAPAFAVEQAAMWAGDDNKRWGDVFAIALGEDGGLSHWREWIKESNPKITERERLEVMLALLQKSQSHGDLREVWIGKIWKAIETEKNEALKTDMVKRLLSLSINQQDVKNTLKAWDMLEPADQASSMWNSIDKFLTADGRWDEAVEVLERAGNNASNPSPEVQAYYAVNLRRAGNEEKAAVHDEMAEKLALGSASSAVRIGSFYLYGGDQKRAAEWFRRAAMQADVQSGEFIAVLSDYADAMSREGNWNVAASCYESLAQVYASQPFYSGSLSSYAKERLSADLAKAMVILPTERERALGILDAIHENFVTDGILADDFFPSVRSAGLIDELEKWFEESWVKIEEVALKYPASHNTRNTAAWFSSRARLKLAEAEKMLGEVIKRTPEQAAYLDTMAELKFAQGDRKAAIEWSQRSVSFAPFDDMIRLQHERFRSGKIPTN